MTSPLPRPLAAYLESAVAAAQAAGDHARRERPRTHEVHARYAHDIKLQLDLECQARATAVLRERHPDHAILGEEDDDAVARATPDSAPRGAPASVPEADGTPRWVIDPIDGTVNFFHGLPLWCSSVALQVGNRSWVGAVYAPEAGELFTATAEDVARLNGVPIRVSAVTRLEEALLVTGLSQIRDGDTAKPPIFECLANRFHKLRVLGSAALDMCRVARGHADAYWEPCIHIWDMAAASLIVERAGGKGLILEQSGTQRNYLACTPALFDPMVTLLQTALPILDVSESLA